MTAARNRCPYCGSPTTPNGHHVPMPSGSVFTAEQWIRFSGFVLGLWRQVAKKPGEAIPSTEQLTLDLAAAVGVPLPTRQDQVAILANGTTVQTKLLPYGAASMPAAHDQEAV
ncbi:hypothetical protein MKK84_24685 [Methylobacterium sp. E-065]|uniref:hypothetical protein n=1 Tax=Methylobacterium sp. E-065 TaxID=2836583 RepID=UPI001FB95B29|nr:hypothetical protein [Methylobacterium sp. E-065]MCJ2020586.1 hypothetical protein [Methylobacterium sp. E-065]